MSATDVQVAPAYLVRVRRLYPGAVGIGKIKGFKHQTAGEITRMEKSGEVIALRRFAKLDELSGMVEIPYVRMREHSEVQRAQAIRVGAMLLGAGMFLTAVGWLLWESRYVIMIGGAGILAMTALLWLAPHWKNGCPGLHCAGCRG